MVEINFKINELKIRCNAFENETKSVSCTIPDTFIHAIKEIGTFTIGMSLFIHKHGSFGVGLVKL